MPNSMLFVALLAAFLIAAYFGIRYFLLKASLRRANVELLEIVERLKDNRIVRLKCPDTDMETLLETVNKTLLEIRYQAESYARKEGEQKAQIERISHDLRTPLTSILGYLALIDQRSLDSETRESLQTIKQKALALQRLINQFYDLSRVRNKDFSIDVEKVDVGRLLREIAASQYKLLDSRGLEVSILIPEHPMLVSANSDALERVFENLFSNAEKYGNAKFEITATLGADLQGVVIEFANDVDLSEESDPECLFEPFYTVDSSRAQESSGLGLTIARHLVEFMGGTLKARVEPREDAMWLVFDISLTQAA